MKHYGSHAGVEALAKADGLSIEGISNLDFEPSNAEAIARAFDETAKMEAEIMRFFCIPKRLLDARLD